MTRGGASPEKVGWKSDRIDGQQVYLTIFMSFLLGNGYLPEESGVDMSTPVHPVAPPLFVTVIWLFRARGKFLKKHPLLWLSVHVPISCLPFDAEDISEHPAYH